MCLYDPPLLLGTPDVSAAVICSLPLAASAVGWKQLLSSSIGLVVGFLAARFLIIALHQNHPPSVFYWMEYQPTTIAAGLMGFGVVLVLVYAVSSTLRGLWRAWHLLLALALLAGVVGAFAYIVADAQALDLPGIDTSPAVQNITPIDCVFPPFGEGTTGYSMLAVLVIFELLVAVGIADMFNRLLAPRPSQAA